MQFGQACSEHWHNPPASFQLTDFRFTRAGYRRLLPLAEIYNATDPNLSAFSRAAESSSSGRAGQTRRSPHSAPSATTRQLSSTPHYHWIDQFRPGAELWCNTAGKNLACSHHQPHISYAP